MFIFSISAEYFPCTAKLFHRAGGKAPFAPQGRCREVLSSFGAPAFGVRVHRRNRASTERLSTVLNLTIKTSSQRAIVMFVCDCGSASNLFLRFVCLVTIMVYFGAWECALTK